MAVADVIVQIDAEITKLQEVKALLTSGAAVALPAVKGRRGRPKTSTSAVTPVAKKAVSGFI